jgi:DNA invertase Pin-like site-specific DNA recombinase
MRTAPAPTYFGYARVSTTEQHQTGAGLPAQLEQLQAVGTLRGWNLEVVTEADGASGSSLRGRPELVAILERLDKSGGGLVVTKLDRLTRSVRDFASILERSRRHGWELVVLDIGVDTSTPSGELVATMLASVAQWERRMIAERTRVGMAQRKREGVHCGRPSALPVNVVKRICREREKGATMQGIADRLNSEGVPTATEGAKWHASTVRRVLTSSTAQRLGVAA